MTLAGQTISEIGKGQFGWPYGIAVNSGGQLVVTDAFSDSVSIYGVSDGKRVRQFGSSGTRDANFRNPYHVTVDARDNILVADSGNDCVKAFDASGQSTGPVPAMKSEATAIFAPQDGRWKITVSFDGRRFCVPKFRR